jgi:hypothetical protein
MANETKKLAELLEIKDIEERATRISPESLGVLNPDHLAIARKLRDPLKARLRRED